MHKRDTTVIVIYCHCICYISNKITSLTYCSSKNLNHYNKKEAYIFILYIMCANFEDLKSHLQCIYIIFAYQFLTMELESKYKTISKVKSCTSLL